LISKIIIFHFFDWPSIFTVPLIGSFEIHFAWELLQATFAELNIVKELVHIVFREAASHGSNHFLVW
jgi:hypothetical protein